MKHATLIKRLEAGETGFSVEEIDKLAYSVLGPSASIADTQLFLDAMKRGSLDAAVALVERVRPGWQWSVASFGSSARAALGNPSPVRPMGATPTKAPTPAAALVAALLRSQDSEP